MNSHALVSVKTLIISASVAFGLESNKFSLMVVANNTGSYPTYPI